MRAPIYLPLTEKQAKRLAPLLARGYTVLRVVRGDVEKLTITKPSARQRAQAVLATSRNVAEREAK